MASIENLVTNGNFENGELDPWEGINAKVTSSPCPALVDTYSASLLGGCLDASIEQLIPVIENESYMLTLSLGTSRKRCSPPVHIFIEYVDELFNVVDIGLESLIPRKQLPNSFEGEFDSVTLFTSKVPIDLDIRYARIIISKEALIDSSRVIIDNVSLARVSDTLATDYPIAYVGNSNASTVSVVGSSQTVTISVAPEPVAMVYVPQRKKVFAVSGEDECISVIDTDTNTLEATISISGVSSFLFNRNITTDSTGEAVYVLTSGIGSDTNGYVYNIDAINLEIVYTAIIDQDPVALALNETTSELYVLCEGDKNIYSISPEGVATVLVNVAPMDSARYLIYNSTNDTLVAGGTGGDADNDGNAVIRGYDLISNEQITVNSFDSDRELNNMVLSIDGTLLYTAWFFRETPSETRTQFWVYKSVNL